MRSLPTPSYFASVDALPVSERRKAAVEIFRQSEFGLFMHYGLYSLREVGERRVTAQ